MLRDSSKVKGAILHRLKVKRISVAQMARDLGLDRKRIFALMNNEYNSYRPTQKDVWRICEYLDIKLQLKIVIDEKDPLQQ